MTTKKSWILLFFDNKWHLFFVLLCIVWIFFLFLISSSESTHTHTHKTEYKFFSVLELLFSIQPFLVRITLMGGVKISFVACATINNFSFEPSTYFLFLPFFECWKQYFFTFLVHSVPLKGKIQAINKIYCSIFTVFPSSTTSNVIENKKRMIFFSRELNYFSLPLNSIE